jgi:hypothetical protein
VLRPPVETAQYTSAEFGNTLKALRMRASMGRVGSCYDCETDDRRQVA